METTNAALLTPDVLEDCAPLFESHIFASPAQLHALHALVEAIVCHECSYAYLPREDLSTLPDQLLDPLLSEDVLKVRDTLSDFEHEMEMRDLKTKSEEVLIDRNWQRFQLRYSSDSLVQTLGSMLDFEQHIGIDRASRCQENMNFWRELLLITAAQHQFTQTDTEAVDGSYRFVRAFSTVAAELGLEPYTGILTRPFLLAHWSKKRRFGLQLYDLMKKELDDMEDSDLPQWRRIDVPALTQTVLANCKGAVREIFYEILQLRSKHYKFRQSLTEQVCALKTAETRGEKRKIRIEHQRAWDALIKKEDQNTRLVHQTWELLKEPTKIVHKTVDILVEKDKLDQAINRVQGLPDLWNEMESAPVMEKNLVV